MKATRFIAPVLVLTIFLTGCSLLPLSADEKKYVDNCQIVYGNFEQYVKLQNKFHYAKDNDPRYDWKSWSDTYLVTNAGQASRDSASNSIKSQFPWVYSMVRNHLQNTSKEKFISERPRWWSYGELEEAVFEGYFQMLASGSSFKVTIDTLKKIDNNFYDVETNKVFGSFAASERFKNCDDALGLKEEKSFDSRESDYGLFGYKGVGLSTILQVSIGIWGCETYGVGFAEYVEGWAKCAKSDYVDHNVYTPSDVMTDEERAILEERGQAAESESQNSSGSGATSNASPMQVCSSLGQVVQTESYGQLTCKLIWLNRVRALVWMRS
jgi:hypothetical protein